MATSRVNPQSPRTRPRHTSAMPPRPAISMSSYRPPTISPGRGSSAMDGHLRITKGNNPRELRRMVSSGAMEPSPGLARFSEVVARDDFALDHAALLIGAWDYPERDLEAYREMLDGIA